MEKAIAIRPKRNYELPQRYLIFAQLYIWLAFEFYFGRFCLIFSQFSRFKSIIRILQKGNTLGPLLKLLKTPTVLILSLVDNSISKRWNF